jgi:hypothetical protein
MINSLRVAKVLGTIAIAGMLAACGKAEPPAAALTTSPVKLTAGIQDIMKDMIDPAADFLWESVSSTETVSRVSFPSAATQLRLPACSRSRRSERV